MQDAGVGLQVDAVGAARLGVFGQQDVAVVHVRALRHLAVHKDKELRVLGVVPFLDLGLQVQVQAAPGIAFGHSDFGAEPIVLVRAVPVGDLGVDRLIRLAVVAAGEEFFQVIGFLMVKQGIRRFGRVGLGRSVR